MKSRNNSSGYGFTLIEVIITLVVAAIVAAMVASYFGRSITQSSLPIFRLQAAGKLNAIMEKITAEYNNNPPTWSQGTVYTAYNAKNPTTGTIIIPTQRNGYQYICTTAGTSGTAEPTKWPTTSDEQVKDGGVTWTYSGATPPDKWSSLPETVNEKAIVYPANGYQYICTTAGIRGTTEPTWPTASGAMVNDGGVQWKNRGLQPLMDLKTRIGNEGSEYVGKTFGGDTQVSYRVIRNRLITFDKTNNPFIEVDLTGNTNHADYGKYLKITIGLHSNEPNRTDEMLTTLFVRR